MFRHSLYRHQEEILSHVKTICLFKVVTVIQLQSVKYVICGFLYSCLRLLKQYCLVVRALKFFKY